MMLLVPGVAIVVSALLVDLVRWDRAPTWDFGHQQFVLLGLGLVACAIGLLCHRLLPDRPVQMAAKVVLGASAALLTLAAIDVVFRVTDPFGLGYYRETSEYSALMVEDDDFAYIHQPRLERVFQGVAVSINSEGFRWSEHSIAKPQGRRRIIVLGDSVVFGWGVEQEQIFPAILQSSLQATHPDWEVISAGVGSWNTRTEYEWLRKRGLDYEPDIVLINIVSNDVFAKTMAPEALSAKWLVRRFWEGLVSCSYVCGYCQNLRSRRNARISEDKAYAVDSEQWKDTERALQSMASICNDNNVLLVAALPYSAEDNRPFMLRYESSLAELNVPHTRLPDVSRHRNSKVDEHPNSEGHRIMSEHIAEFLEPLISRNTE